MTITEILARYWPYLLSGFMCMMLAVITAAGWYMQQMEGHEASQRYTKPPAGSDWPSFLKFIAGVALVATILGGLIPLWLMGKAGHLMTDLMALLQI